MTERSESAGFPLLSQTLSLSLWLGLVFGLVRAGLLFGMERYAHGVELDLVQLRLAAVLPTLLLEGAVLGGAIVFSFASLGRLTPRARRIAWTLAVLAFGALLALWFGGWARGDASRTVGLGTERGRTAVVGIAVLALLLSALGAWSAVRLRARRRSGKPALPLGIALLLGLGVGAVWGGVNEQMELRRVLARLVDDEWEVVEAPSHGAPRRAVICPSADYGVDGSDMAALIVPPSSTIGLGLELDGDARLFARAGVDRSVFDADVEGLAGTRVRFSVRVDGTTVASAEVELQGEGDFPGTAWRDLGNAEGIEVGATSRLELSTELVDAAGERVIFGSELPAGFGGLTLERREHRERTRSSPEQPNIVLIVMDTLRADRLGVYGCERPTSPRLDALAARGLVFEEACATSSWTWPSTASILTGMLPQEHGVLDATSCFLADDFTTLAEALQAQGFTTAAFSGNPLIVPGRNFDQGFEVFEFAQAVTRKSRVVAPGALEWLESVAGNRFFLYLHLTDPHAPLTPHPEGRAQLASDVPEDFDAKAIVHYAGELLKNCGHTEAGERATEQCVPAEHQQWIADLYDACVWTGDHWLGRVLDTLEQLELDDETIVVFTSDHGEELFDHGLATHGHALHRELVRVPLVLAGPGVPSGVRTRTPVSNRHLAPTLARMARAPWSGADDGLLLEEAAPSREVFFSTERGWWKGRYPQRILGVRAGPWILHHAPAGAPWGAYAAGHPSGGAFVLFDTREDPGEQTDRAAENPDLAAQLKERLVQRMLALEARRTQTEVPAGDATVDMLKGLGYLGEDE